MRITPRIAQPESVALCIFKQPSKCGRLLEFPFRRGMSRRRDVESSSGVVFTVAGSGIDAQDFLDTLTAIELALENTQLILNAAKCRYDLQLDPVG